jgi:hypothetical protein
MNNPNSKSGENVARVLTFLLAIALVVLNIIRVINVPITHDEAWTYNEFISASYRNILICNPITANNHILNSLLAKFFTGIFQSNSLLIIRLPNLLALCAYITSGYLLLRRLCKNEWWVLAGLLLLNLNPFLFDFWGLCRGYGLAIGLMMTAIYFFLRYDMDAKPRDLFISLLFAGLATLSNFSILNFYLALVGVIALQALVASAPQRKSKIIWASSAIIFCSLLLYIMIVQPIIELRQTGELYFGGAEGFVPDTIKSVVAESLYTNKAQAAVTLIAIMAIVSVLLATVIASIQAFKSRVTAITLRHLYIMLLLLIPVLSTILQFRLLGTLLLIERTALFFYPLFILVIIIALFSIRQVKLLPTALLLLLVVAFCYNFARHINISYSRTWEYDRYDKLVVDRMATHTSHPVKVKPYWMFINSFKYYQATTYSRQMAYVENRFEDSVYAPQQYDYYYIHRDELEKLPLGYILDTSFFDGKYLLFKKQD